jgi:hypothetical protein
MCTDRLEKAAEQNVKSVNKKGQKIKIEMITKNKSKKETKMIMIMMRTMTRKVHCRIRIGWKDVEANEGVDIHSRKRRIAGSTGVDRRVREVEKEALGLTVQVVCRRMRVRRRLASLLACGLIV